MKTVLISGATGVVGTALIATAPLDYWVHALSHDRLDSPEPLPKADIIIHAAGYGVPALFTKYALETIRVNTETTTRLLNCLNPGGTFVYCSSSEVYSGFGGAAKETDIGTTNPQHPRSCYIEGKRCGEAIVEAYRKTGVNAISARVALAYGPGTKRNDGRAITQFINQALQNGRIELKDPGTSFRTVCYSHDTARIIWDIVDRGKQSVYNVGGPTVASIADIAKTIGGLVGAEVIIPEDDGNGLAGAPQNVFVDFSRIQEEFGKRTYTSLNDGLYSTIDWESRYFL